MAAPINKLFIVIKFVKKKKKGGFTLTKTR